MSILVFSSVLRLVNKYYYGTMRINHVSSIVSARSYATVFRSYPPPLSSTHTLLLSSSSLSSTRTMRGIRSPSFFFVSSLSSLSFSRSYSSSLPLRNDTTNLTEGKGRRRRTMNTSRKSTVKPTNAGIDVHDAAGEEEDKFVTLTRDEAERLGILEELVKDTDPSNSLSPSSSPSITEPLTDIIRSTKYKGVLKEGKEAILWEAVITINGKEISGGEYETEEEAAKAYDALVRMYYSHLPNIDEQTNFPIDPHTVWLPPEEIISTGQIETKPGVPLTVDEIRQALEQEKGINVQIVNLAGKSDLAEALIFVTGRSVVHMRKMADLVARALRKRRLYGINPTVEARDADDWMVVDCGNIIVSIMDAEAREVFALEEFWNSMKLGQDPYAGMSHEEWIQKNPVPDKWIKRLEKDEEEFEREKKLLTAPSQQTTDNKFHFRTKLDKSNGNKYGRKR